jgi:RNA polymerase sigma-70 factor (ECF subfamily)
MRGPASRLDASAALVERICAGDERAFETLFRDYHAPLCAFAYRYLGARDVAEEIVQEIFLFIWERRETLDIRGSFKTYLFTSVRNAAVSYLRHERIVRRHEVASAPFLVQGTSADRELVHNELKVAVRQAIADLPARCQLVFTLHREEGLTYNEIGKVMGIAPKTVENHMIRALKGLREALAAFRS